MAQRENTIAENSKRPDFSPAQPWRAKTRLVPSKAAANYHFIRGGWDDPNCARPTRAFSSRALREHGDRPSHPAPFFSILLRPMHALRQEPLNPSAHQVEPLSCLEIRKEIGQIAPHSLA